MAIIELELVEGNEDEPDELGENISITIDGVFIVIDMTLWEEITKSIGDMWRREEAAHVKHCEELIAPIRHKGVAHYTHCVRRFFWNCGSRINEWLGKSSGR